MFDFFFNSLHATQIRSKITSLLQCRQANVDVPQNIVYQRPTITHLSNWLLGMMSRPHSPDAGSTSSSESDEAAAENLQLMISSYTKRRSKSTILLTGTTGSLGAYVLADILQNRNVDRIFALNRVSSQDILQRHIITFEERGLDGSLLKDSRLTLLTANRKDDLSQENRIEVSIAPS